MNACAHCGCETGGRKSCDGTCRVNLSRGKVHPTACAGSGCEKPLEPGRPQELRYFHSYECLDRAKLDGRLRGRRAPAPPSGYVSREVYEKQRPPDIDGAPVPERLRCKCGGSVVVDSDDPRCLRCGLYVEDRFAPSLSEHASRRIEHLMGSKTPARASKAPARAAISDPGGLRTRELIGNLPKEPRACAQCGSPLRKGKRGKRCDGCDELPAFTRKVISPAEVYRNLGHPPGLRAVPEPSESVELPGIEEAV